MKLNISFKYKLSRARRKVLATINQLITTINLRNKICKIIFSQTFSRSLFFFPCVSVIYKKKKKKNEKKKIEDLMFSK